LATKIANQTEIVAHDRRSTLVPGSFRSQKFCKVGTA
jgi:hypothetical protein